MAVAGSRWKRVRLTLWNTKNTLRDICSRNSVHFMFCTEEFKKCHLTMS